jgi:two-component system, chemotaxis family, CheB/CheR fusion protein
MDRSVVRAERIEAASPPLEHDAHTSVAGVSDDVIFLTQTVRSPVALLHADHRVAAVNEAFCRVFGLDAAEAVGEPISGLSGGGWASAELDSLLESLEKMPSSVTNAALDLPTSSGQRLFLVNGRRLERAAELEPLIVLSLEHDTGAATLPDEATVADQRRRLLLETSPDGLLVIDPATRKIVSANPAVTRVLEYRLDDLIGKELWEVGLLAPDQALKDFKALEEGGFVVHDELAVWTPRGNLRLVDAECAQFEENGRPIVHCSLRDVTRLQSLEKALGNLAAIVESSDDAIVSKDLNGVIATWNNAAQRLFGYTAEEAIGHPVTILIPEERHDEEPGILSRIRRGERIDHYETVRRRKDGTLLDISLSVSPIINARGQIVGVSKIARDITERRRNEAALKEVADKLAEADHRKNEFLAMLAHELRNPLAPIRNALELLRRSEAIAPAIQPASDMIGRQLAQMVRLIDDLLEVSRITSGAFGLRRERVELGSLARQAVEAALPLCQAREQSLTVRLPRSAVYVDADPTRFNQIVGNLLHNASKFTDRGGEVALIVEASGRDVTIRVRDNGIGIAAADLPRIFEMFSQADRSLERSTGGLGIGLALVKQMAEMHGGTVTATSGGIGHGSEFTVSLPIVVDAPAPERTVSGLEVPQVAARRVLVVDDNRDAATSLAMLLELNGHEVRVVHDGVEALAEAERFRPQVMLLDIGLPRLNGHEAARAIRKEPWGKDILLVALTGWGHEEDRQKSREAGFDAHLVKPVELKGVLLLLASAPPH